MLLGTLNKIKGSTALLSRSPVFAGTVVVVVRRGRALLTRPHLWVIVVVPPFVMRGRVDRCRGSSSCIHRLLWSWFVVHPPSLVCPPIRHLSPIQHPSPIRHPPSAPIVACGGRGSSSQSFAVLPFVVRCLGCSSPIRGYLAISTSKSPL